MPFPPGAFHFPSVDPLDSSDESAWRENHQKNYHDAGDNDHYDDDDHCHDDAGDDHCHYDAGDNDHYDDDDRCDDDAGDNEIVMKKKSAPGLGKVLKLFFFKSSFVKVPSS